MKEVEVEQPLFSEDDKNNINQEGLKKEESILIKSEEKPKNKKIGKEVWFAVTILGRIIMTLYSFHGVFFIYNFIIQYIILVPGILYDINSLSLQIFLGIFYLIFALSASNLLVIPTYEFLLLQFLNFKNPLYHLQSFGRVINIIENQLEKEDKSVENENEDNLIVNIFLIIVEFFYITSYLFALASISTSFKDVVKIVILFVVYLYYLMIFFGYVVLSIYFIYKFLRYSWSTNKIFYKKITNAFVIDSFFGDNDKYKDRNIGPLPKINLLSYVFHPLMTKAYNVDEKDKEILRKKDCQDLYLYIRNCCRISLFIFSLVLTIIVSKIKETLSIIFFIFFFVVILCVSTVLNFPVCFRNKKTFGHFFSGKIKYKEEYKMRRPSMVAFVRLICNVIIALASLLLFFSFFYIKDMANELPTIKELSLNLKPNNQTIDTNTLLLPSICFSYVQNIPIHLYLPFINDAYYYTNKPSELPYYYSSFDIEKYRKLFFDDSYDIKVLGDLIDHSKKGENEESVKMIQYNVKNSQNEVTILSIKGTSNKKDIYMDFQLYFPSILLNILTTFSILGQQKKTLSFKFMEYSLSIPYRLFFQYSVINEYLKDLTDAYNNHTESFYKNVIIVGHSLGGGLAKLLGRLLNKQAISLSGPGVNAFHSLWEYEGFSENFEISAIDLVPDMDLVPRVEVSGGTIYRIICKTGPFACHSKAMSLCEVLIMCRNPNYYIYCQKLGNLTDSEINELVQSSELNYEIKK